MKCDRAQRNVLLAQSDELSEGESKELEAHIAGCRSCMEFSRDSNELLAIAGRVLPSSEPSEAVMAKIFETALERVARRPIMVLSLMRHSVVAAAAAALVLISGYAYLRQGLDVGSSAEVSAILEILSESETGVSGESTGIDDAAVARQLLKMQGLYIDDAFDIDVFSLYEEHQATDRQSRSDDGTFREGYV